MKKRLWILSVLLLFCALVFSSCAVDEGDCAHEFGEWTTVKNATCKEEGEAIRACGKCSFEESQVIEKSKEHSEVVDPAVAPTCEEPGKTEGKHCSVCDRVIKKQMTVPLLDHTYDNADDETCNACGRVKEVTDILKGLTVNALGDSYFEGHGLPQSKVWLGLLASKYDIKMNNYGVGGSTVSDYVNKNPMCVRYTSMSDNYADIVLLEGGRNDFNNEVPLGDVDSHDTKTFLGALNVTIEGLKAKYPDAMIVCISNWNFPGTKNELGCADYANAMEAVAQKQGVYFIRACDPAVSGIDMQDEDFRAKYCLKHDDISHLNAAGMKIALSNFEKLIAEYYHDFLVKK